MSQHLDLTHAGGCARRGGDRDDPREEYHGSVSTAPETKAGRGSIIVLSRKERYPEIQIVLSICWMTKSADVEGEIEMKLTPGGEITDQHCEGTESSIAEMRWFQGA